MKNIKHEETKQDKAIAWIAVGTSLTQPSHFLWSSNHEFYFGIIPIFSLAFLSPNIPLWASLIIEIKPELIGYKGINYDTV